jgi:hypothetical protein
LKAYLKNILIFLTPLIILAYPLDMFISHNLAKSNDYQGELEVWNDIYEGKINAEIAIYGSSRSWVGINPKIMEERLDLKAYNFGIDGHNFWLQYLRHLKYLETNQKPKHIVLAVDFGSLQKRDDLYQYEQFLPYMLWDKDIIKYTKTYIGFSQFDYYIPLLRYVGKSSVLNNSFNQYLGNENNSKYRNNGYRAVDKEWTNEFALAKSKLENFTVIIDYPSLSLLESFIQSCKKENIELTLVYTPEYIEVNEIVTNKKSIIQLYQELCNENKIRFLDYSFSEISFDRENFYNATHLNKRGSILFSKTLAIDLLNIE